MPNVTLLQILRKELAQASLLAIAYFIAAYAAVTYTRVGGGVALLWFATPLLAVDLRYRPERSWTLRLVGCAIASALATTIHGLGLQVALPFALLGVAEGAAIAWLMRRVEPTPRHLTSLRELGLLLLVAGLAVPAATALPAGLLAHGAADLPVWRNAFNWFVAHSLGTLTVMPIVKLVIGGDVTAWSKAVRRRELYELAALTTLHVTVAVLVFAQTQLPLLFVPLLPLMLMVFRFGRLGAALALLLLTIIGSVCTARGLGPVAMPELSAGGRIQLIELYLAVATLMALPAATELKRRKILFSEVQEQAALHKIITDRSGDIIMAVTADGRISRLSPSLMKIACFAPEAVVGKLAREIVSPEDVEQIVDAHRRAMLSPDQTIIFEFRAMKASGEMAWFESHACAISDEHGQASGTVNVVREVSRRKAVELDLARAAATDALTGLPNRRGLEIARERLAQAGKPGQQFLALFDIDRFKAVNDTFGHASGDDVLRTFASVLTANTRGTDAVARLGGEEFAVLYLDVRLAEARAACERIRLQFAAERLALPDGRQVAATVSVGLAPIPDDGDLEGALIAADQALYRSKNAGRNMLSLAA